MELENTPDTENVEAPALTEMEQKALDMGWRPREEFDGSDDDFIEAKEFVRRKPLFDKIESQSKEIKAVKRALEEFKQHYTKVEERALTQAIQKLKEQRKTALSEGDGDRFEQLDDQIQQVEEQVERVKQAAATPIVKEEVAAPAEFTSWVSRNSWYENTSYMRKFADDLGASYASAVQSGEMTTSQVLKEVERRVRAEFPHKFTNGNKQSAPDVESSRAPTSRAKSGEVELTEVERKVMNDLVRTGVLTKEQYLADIKKIKEKK